MERFRKARPSFQLQYDPAEIRILEAEYLETSKEDDQEMEDAGKRIASGDYRRENLEAICRWKSVRRIGLLSYNTDSEIELALKRAIGAADVKEAVDSLTPLDGVGVKMASAILTAIDPERYTVLDFRALEALGLDDSEDADLYVFYVEACRRMAENYGVTMRAFDRANWQWSKRRARLSREATHCNSYPP
jgi:hypothetical protein